MRSRVKVTVLGMCLSLLLVGCGNKLSQAIQVTSDMAAASGVILDTTEEWWEAGDITAAEAETIIDANRSILLSLREVNNLLRTVCGLEGPDARDNCPKESTAAIKSRFRVLLPRIVESIQTLNNEGVLQLKDPEKRQTLTIALDGIRQGLPILLELLED